MLLKIVKTTALVAIAATTLNAASFDTQAEKDRLALVKYMEAKFANTANDNGKFFPYSTAAELKKFKQAPKHSEFSLGTYAFDKIGKMSRDDQMDMPPFEENAEKGEVLYNKYIKQCISNPATLGDYPMFNNKTGKVDTLSEAIVNCAKGQKLPGGKKGWNLKGGKTADVQAYMSMMSQDEEKKIDIKISSAAAEAAYEEGKKEFYTQRGYLKLSCATCHVQGAGKRVRLQLMSPAVGNVTHFPVYRVGKGKLFTLEGRLGGCNRDTGEQPHKAGSDWSSNVLYFMSYMSNGMNIAQDVRR
ncbi:MAG TPA: sulfur oxidation c-type cytochrome SoxA [Arcobacter sp.]|nr:sulfur oxidation c-type cytochrome SoxA [Arcobacter sp.]